MEGRACDLNLSLTLTENVKEANILVLTPEGQKLGSYQAWLFGAKNRIQSREQGKYQSAFCSGKLSKQSQNSHELSSQINFPHK